MPHSHHSHSGQFCRHAKDSLAEVVAEAARKGFTVFGLSEHAPRYREQDLFPEESDLTPTDLETAYAAFLVEAARLRSSLPPDSPLKLLLGIESDFISPIDSTGLGSLLSRHPEIDYVVGSVHHVGGVSIDFDRPTWLRAVRDVSLSATQAPKATMMRNPGGELVLVSLTPDDDPRLAPGYVPSNDELRPFLEAYLDAQYELLTAHQPEVVGHFDLCLLWTPDKSLKDMDTVWERVERNVRYAVGYGALFEANAAAIRKGWSTSYPSRDVLRLILSLNGRLCLSDDSHGVAYVGLNYTPMREYLVSEGVRVMWHLVPAAEAQKGDMPVGARGRVVARAVEGWEEDAFWGVLERANAESK